MQSGLGDRVDNQSVGQAAGACRADAGREQETVLLHEVGLPLPLVVGLVGDCRIVANMRIVGGDGGAARLGRVEHLPHFRMAGSVGVLDVLQNDIVFGLVEAVEEFDALQFDRLVGLGHVLAWDAINAEHAIGGAGQVRHLGDMHGRSSGEGRAGHVDGGGRGIHGGLADDLPVGGGLACLHVSTVGAGAHADVGAEVDARRVRCLRQHAGHVRFRLADVDLTGTVEVATQVAFNVLGGVLQEVHDLRVERVGAGLAAVALALASGHRDTALLAHGGQLLAAHGRDLAAKVAERILRVGHARTERAIRQKSARHRRIAVILRVRIPDGEIVRIELELIEANGRDDEHVAIRAIISVIASQALDGLHHRRAIVVHRHVRVEHAERGQSRVIVTSGTIIRAWHDGQTGIVADLHAVRRIGKRVERETHAIRAPVTMRGEILAHIRHNLLCTVVGELGAVHDTILLRALQTGVITQTQKLIGISQNKPP